MARGAFSSMRDLRAKHGQELGQPGRMRGPGRRGHQIAVGMGLIDGDLGIGAARQPHLGRAGRIGRAGASLQDAGGRSSCAPWHTAAIGFSPGRRPARYPVPCRSGAGIPARGAGNHQPCVGRGLDAVEVVVQREIVAALRCRSARLRNHGSRWPRIRRPSCPDTRHAPHSRPPAASGTAPWFRSLRRSRRPASAKSCSFSSPGDGGWAPVSTPVLLPAAHCGLARAGAGGIPLPRVERPYSSATVTGLASSRLTSTLGSMPTR